MKKILIGLIGFFCLQQLQAETIQNFELPVHNQDKIFKMEEQKGKTVVLNFFASWCIACIQEMPELNALKNKYSSADYVFVAINAGDKPNQIKKLLSKYHFDFLILEDVTKAVSKKLGVNELPRTMVISPAGEIIYSSSTPPKNLK